MRIHSFHPAARLCLLLMVGGTLLPASDWYVEAGAASGGNGSKNRPFNSLAQVEAASAAGDTINILQASPALALDGGLQLKPNQKLIGLGPKVTVANPNSQRAKLTNTTRARYDGDIVRLSTNNVVENIHFDNAYRASIFGVNASGAVLRENLVTADMAMHDLFTLEGPAPSTCRVISGTGVCTGEWPNGFIIFAPQTNHFGAITLLACGPQPRALPKDPLVRATNYCSGLVPGSGVVTAPVQYEIKDNVVRDGNSDGIMIINDGGATVTSKIEDNLVKNLSQALPDPSSVGSTDHVVRSRGITVITIDGTTSHNDIEGFTGSNLSPAGTFASDGFVLLAVGLNPVVNTELDGVLIDNPNLTGEAINGDSIEIQHRSSINGLLNVSIKNAILKDPANANIKLIDSNNPVNGTYRISVANSFLYNRNTIGTEDNQIRYFATAVGTKVKEISLDLKQVVVSGVGRGFGSAIAGNVSDIDTLKVKMEDCTFTGLTDEGAQWVNPATRTLGTVGGAILDFGGGPLGSQGRNRFFANGVPGYVPPGADPAGIDATEGGQPVVFDAQISLTNARLAPNPPIQLWANDNYWGGAAPTVSSTRGGSIYVPAGSNVVVHPITSYRTNP